LRAQLMMTGLIGLDCAFQQRLGHVARQIKGPRGEPRGPSSLAMIESDQNLTV
jgi:hypothetical protein